jgi:hypothetical protein
MAKEFVPDESDLRDVNSMDASPQLRSSRPSQDQLDAEASARAAKNRAIFNEIDQTWGNKKFNREGTHEELKALNTAVSTFRSAPHGPKKEAARNSAWNIVQGIKANKGMTNPTRAIMPHGQIMPCATPGCKNEVPFMGADATCEGGKCDVRGVDVQRPKE